jgi:hypothetical protein
MEQIASKLLYFIFGVAELILACVGGVEAGDHCQFGSWMIFVSLCLSFCEAGKGLRIMLASARYLARMRHFEELRDV